MRKSKVMGQWLKERVQIKEVFLSFFNLVFAADEIDLVEGGIC